MKTFILCLLCVSICTNMSTAQSSNIEKIEDIKSNNIKIETDYLDVRFETWNNDYVEVKSEVKINLGRDDDKLDLKIRNTNKGITILSSVDCKAIEKMVILTDKEGNKSYTPMKDWDDSMKGRVFSNMNIGYEIDGELTIYIPDNMNLEIETTYGDVFINGDYREIQTHSTYGLIEAKLKDVSNMDRVSFESTYDIVDLTLNKDSDASLNLNTSYGAIYTDLPLQNKQSNNVKSKNSCSHSSSEKFILNNGSVSIDIEATYDNIYVRSTNKSMKSF